jgi:hypothetical protein
MNTIRFENRAHGVVTADLAFVGWVLQVARLDVFPDFLDGLGS